MAQLPLLLIALLVLLLASAFFSCAETAFFSLNRIELGRLRLARNYASARLVRLLSRPRDTLIGLLLGNEVANCAIAILFANIVTIFIDSSLTATVVSVALATPIVLLVGEVLPKNLAVGFASRISPVLVIPVTAFLWFTTPVRWVLMHIADGGVRLFGGDPRQVRAMIFEEEFRQLVNLGQESGALSTSEREWIHGIFSFTDMKVASIMTPAEKVFCIPLGWPLEKILEEMRQTQFSRVPVFHEHLHDIIGLLYMRDLISLHRRKARGLAVELEEVIRPVLFVTGETDVAELLRELQRTKIHMAIVRNHTQEMVGVVTLDDLLDAFIGERSEGHP
ncbi:MAG: HlyC/CorC family transporter [Deltaproteobacteria bacterium]|nr:HlyC/CorC family transporter [Deltaproteobacteria bacterium]